MLFGADELRDLLDQFAARAFAMGRGFHLAADIELDILRARVLYGAITFDELRVLFVARLYPFSEGPEPKVRKRPR